MSMTLEHGPVRKDSRSLFSDELLRCDGCGRELDIREKCVPVSVRVDGEYVRKKYEPGDYCVECADSAGKAASTVEAMP
jgi:hypothetical protein